MLVHASILSLSALPSVMWGIFHPIITQFSMFKNLARLKAEQSAYSTLLVISACTLSFFLFFFSSADDASQRSLWADADGSGRTEYDYLKNVGRWMGRLSSF